MDVAVSLSLVSTEDYRQCLIWLTSINLYPSMDK